MTDLGTLKYLEKPLCDDMVTHQASYIHSSIELFKEFPCEIFLDNEEAIVYKYYGYVFQSNYIVKINNCLTIAFCYCRFQIEIYKLIDAKTFESKAS